MKRYQLSTLSLVGLITGMMIWGVSPSKSETLDDIIGIVVATNQIAQESQVTIDSIADNTQKVLQEYRTVNRQVDDLRIYNRQVEELISSQEAEVAQIREDIANVTIIDRRITPLMLRMVDSIGEFIGLDIPFHMEERENRVAGIREMMNRADVTNAEKFRRVLETYQIESEFGRTIDAYDGDLIVAGQPQKTVEFLRIGRIALFYQSRDGTESGVWSQDQHGWVPLSNSYRNTIRQGLRMAYKQVPPNLLTLPISAPENQ